MRCFQMCGNLLYCRYNSFCIGTAQIFVCLDQRLTFRCIDDKILCLRIQFYVGREAGSSGSHYSRFLNGFHHFHT